MVYENAGQKELRQFDDLLSKTDLSHSERSELVNYMSNKIDNLQYAEGGKTGNCGCIH